MYEQNSTCTYGAYIDRCVILPYYETSSTDVKKTVRLSVVMMRHHLATTSISFFMVVSSFYVLHKDNTIIHQLEFEKMGTFSQR